MIDYNGRIFRSRLHAGGGPAASEMTTHYTQTGSHITATYSGGNIVDGSLAATADEAGNLSIRYQHIDTNGQFFTGTCFSRPETMANGKIRLYEQWQWSCGDYSQGESVAEEI